MCNKIGGLCRHRDAFCCTDKRVRPFSVRRYFCRRDRGLSGIVYSSMPSESNVSRTDFLNLVLSVLPSVCINSSAVRGIMQLAATRSKTVSTDLPSGLSALTWCLDLVPIFHHHFTYARHIYSLYTIAYSLHQTTLRARGVCSRIPHSVSACAFLRSCPGRILYHFPLAQTHSTGKHSFFQTVRTVPTSSITLYVIYCNMCQSIQNHNSQQATTHSATVRRRACVHAQMPEIRCPV